VAQPATHYGPSSSPTTFWEPKKLIVKHTKCGLLGPTNEMAREIIKNNSGIERSEELEDMDFLPFESLEKAVKEDAEWFRNHKLKLGKVKVTGWIHDIDTGVVRKIVE
jgi:carbonic anhydrase